MEFVRRSVADTDLAQTKDRGSQHSPMLAVRAFRD